MEVRSKCPSAWSHRVLSGGLTLLLVVLMAGATAFAGRPTSTGAQSAPLSTAVAVPDSALVYLAMTAEQTSTQWQLATTLLDRAGLSSFVDEAIEEARADANDDDLTDLEPFLGGEIAVVVTSLAATQAVDVTGLTGGLAPAAEGEIAGDPAGFALIVQAADPAAAWAKAQELIEEDALTQGVTAAATDYNGVPVVSIPPGSESEDGTAIAQVDDLILVSSTGADLEPLIDTAAGTTPSIMTAPDFAMLQAELNQEFLLFGYINGQAISTALEATEELGAFESLTLGSVPFLDSSTSVVLWADDPGFRFDTVSTLATNTPAPIGENFDGTLNERVPSDTLFFIDGMDLGASGALDTLALLLAQELNGEEAGATPPAGTDQQVYIDQQFEQASTQFGFNIKTDLIDQLVGEFGFALGLGEFLLDPNSVNAIFVSGVESGATVADALSKLALLIGSGVAGEGSTTTVTTRDLDGSVIHVVEDMSSGFPIKVDFGVVADQLLIGFGTSLDSFVGGTATDSLADNPQYQAVMATLPAEHAGSMYLDVARVIEIVTSFSSSMSDSAEPILDADTSCGEFATQVEAQAAYDADAFAQSALDQNFDGIACEDFFSPAAAASPAAELDFSAIRALATVSSTSDGVVSSNTILYIEAE